MRNKTPRGRENERGISLLLSLLALLLLTAVAMGMMFMSSTETSINSNFKAEETAYFAARAGVEEARDRLLPANPNTIANLLPGSGIAAPGYATPASAGGALYILQPGVTLANVKDMSSSNKLKDDELCHDWGNPSVGGMTWQPANVPCTNLPATPGWATNTQSMAPFANSPNPLEYKWVRITLKANNSSSYCVDNTAYPCASSNQACWNGTSEVVAPAGMACSALTPLAGPVYLITSLAVTPTGARRLVQQEIAQTPVGPNPGSPLPGGLFATGNGCSALVLAGNAHTGSFSSATENPPSNPPTNLTNTNGNVGTNGNAYLGGSSTQVNGNVATNEPATVGNCPGNGVTVSGNPGYTNLSNFPNPANLPVPPLPNPLPPTTSVTERNVTLAPGSYGNVTVKGTVTLQGGTTNAPAVYTLNSLTLNGNANLVITGPVIINIAGVGQNPVVDMTGGSFSNTTNIPGDFVINYGGSAGMKVSGGTNAYAVVNAPNAAITLIGGSNFYGQVIGKTIDDQGGTNFYWDTSLNTMVPGGPAPNTAPFYEISLRELSY